MTIPTPSRRFPLLGATITFAVLVGACSGTSDKKAGAKSDVVTTVVDGTSSPGASGTGRSQQPTQAGQAAGDDSQVVGSSTGQHRASPNDPTLAPLRLDVRAVKRLSGDTIGVRFTITNTGAEAEFKPYSVMADPGVKGGALYDVGGLALLDRAADKKYLTLYGTDGVCLCTAGLSSLEIAPGTSASMHADVTAPPATVSTVDLTLPGFAPVIGLKIQ